MAGAEAGRRTLGRPAPHVIERAGHFLQEDRGEEIGAIVAEWLGG